MAPAPATPSPHRFITSKPANASTRPLSSLRVESKPSEPSSSQQFAPLPKFTFGSVSKTPVERATISNHFSSPLSRRPLPPAKPQQRVDEDIEETFSGEDENNENAIDETSSPPSTKRRRPNPAEAVLISSDTPSPTSPPTSPPHPSIEDDEVALEQTELATSPIAHPPPRFLLSNSKPDPTPSIPNRPPVVLPPRSPSPPPAPPAFFSPHRRSQKYVPGGLASAMRDFVVETSQVAHNRAHSRRGEQETWDHMMRVSEMRAEEVGTGVMLLRGAHGSLGWLLVGRARGGGDVAVGCTVGVKEPTWEIDLDDESWRVGVEWKVVD